MCELGLVSLPLSSIRDKYDTLPAPVDKLQLLVLVVNYDAGGRDELHDVWQVSLLRLESPNIDTREVITRPAGVAVPLTMATLIISRYSQSLLGTAEGLLTTRLT